MSAVLVYLLWLFRVRYLSCFWMSQRNICSNTCSLETSVYVFRVRFELGLRWAQVITEQLLCNFQHKNCQNDDNRHLHGGVQGPRPLSQATDGSWHWALQCAALGRNKDLAWNSEKNDMHSACGSWRWTPLYLVVLELPVHNFPHVFGNRAFVWSCQRSDVHFQAQPMFSKCWCKKRNWTSITVKRPLR